MAQRRSLLTAASCGLGFFWAWCYCLWFVPNIYTGTVVVPPGENWSWLVVLGSAALVHFVLPWLLKTRRLSSLGWLRFVVPLATVAGTVGIELTERLVPSLALYYGAAVVCGVSSAFLFHLWGAHYAATRNGDAESIAFGFGVVVLASIVLTSLMPSALSNVYVALTPLASGALLAIARRRAGASSYPALLPKASRKTSRNAIVRVCLIAFLTCVICTFMWAIVPLEQLPIGFDAMALGVAAGAVLMIVAALPKLLFNEKMPTGRILTWMLVLAAFGIALYLAGGSEALMLSYIASMASSVALDVLLATYFVALIVKGYVASSTAFGYSEGFICAGMLVGNVLHNGLEAAGLLSEQTVLDICLAFMCALMLLVVLLNDQQRSIHEIMTAPRKPSALERHAAAIADEFKLSAREFEILELLGQGFTAQGIAKRMVISPYTVQTHIKHIYQKMGIHSRTELLDYLTLRQTDA